MPKSTLNSTCIYMYICDALRLGLRKVNLNTEYAFIVRSLDIVYILLCISF